jgi:hypothetical protein
MACHQAAKLRPVTSAAEAGDTALVFMVHVYEINSY